MGTLKFVSSKPSTLGIEVELEEEAPPEEETDTPKKKKKKKKKAEPNLPVTNVLFSQFIVQ